MIDDRSQRLHLSRDSEKSLQTRKNEVVKIFDRLKIKFSPSIRNKSCQTN